MTASKHWQEVAEEAILDYFRTHNAEPFHSDDLWHIIPDQHRGVISLAVMALVNKKLIVGCGYRKSAIPSRKRSPSQEYRLTELGRDRVVGICVDGHHGDGASRGFPSPSPASINADPGEQSAPTGAPQPKGPDRSTNPPVPSASATNSPAVESAPQLAVGESAQLFELDAVRPKALSAHRDPEAA